MPDSEMASHSAREHLTTGSRESWLRAKEWTSGTVVYADWTKNNLQTVFPGQPARYSHLTGRVGENCCAIEKARRPSLSILSAVLLYVSHQQGEGYTYSAPATTSQSVHLSTKD